MSEVNWHSLLFLLQFLKKCSISQAWLWFHFQTKNLVDHLDWVILNLRAPQKHVLKYVPENRSSSRVVTGKRLLKH